MTVEQRRPPARTWLLAAVELAAAIVVARLIGWTAQTPASAPVGDHGMSGMPGMAVAPTTGGSNFAGAKYIAYINTTLFQPFVGYIWNPGKFYLQGFSAFEFPVNATQATEMYNDIGMGYFLKRTSDPTAFLTALAPTFAISSTSASLMWRFSAAAAARTCSTMSSLYLPDASA